MAGVMGLLLREKLEQSRKHNECPVRRKVKGENDEEIFRLRSSLPGSGAEYKIVVTICDAAVEFRRHSRRLRGTRLEDEHQRLINSVLCSRILADLLKPSQS